MSESTFGFGEALKQLNEGSRVGRVGWNAHHVLALQNPNVSSKMTRPYIYMIIGENAKDLQGELIPWVASHTDLLAGDWYRDDQ